MTDSNTDQIPFDGMEFANNPEPRCPCVLLLDTSGSMAGTKIAQLNDGLKTFEEQLKADAMASKRVEVAIVTFGPVDTVQDFVTADSFFAPSLTANGDTPMGAAIQTAVDMVTERKLTYQRNGVGYYRPWIFLITDGTPTDDTSRAAALVREQESGRKLMLFAVGVDSADMPKLSQVAVRQPLMLKGLAFRELFVWLSNSLGTVSRTQTTDAPDLANPAAPSGWAVAG